ncbi:hypothetical protein UFOVP641_19 [uncultured Caudovirales phage]|uniref:Uncharacterized protein n=1 Tax=uncultured Caudovirales phage TaxID=2100421 RepID=A0A6J5N3Q0_9CAUD|nr:hypothetical protein UFOVP641_19 [uncultured Caudovirales phage]
MKKLFLVLALVAQQAHAQVIITPQGNYTYSSSGSTTYVTGPSNSSGVQVAVPVTTNSATGIGMVHTPSGSYMVQRSGSTTTVIQTSKSK